MATERFAAVRRTTRETDIEVKISLDGTGRGQIDTGIPFMEDRKSVV